MVGWILFCNMQISGEDLKILSLKLQALFLETMIYSGETLKQKANEKIN